MAPLKVVMDHISEAFNQPRKTRSGAGRSSSERMVWGKEGLGSWVASLAEQVGYECPYSTSFDAKVGPGGPFPGLRLVGARVLAGVLVLAEHMCGRFFPNHGRLLGPAVVCNACWVKPTSRVIHEASPLAEKPW